MKALFLNLERLIEELSPISFRELHDCIKFKKLVRFEIYLKDIFKLSQQVQKLNLHHSVSDKSFQVVADASMDNWSSSIIECTDTHKKAMRFVYIHADKDVCEKAKLLDSYDDDLNFGILLQYPKCCIEAYLNWQKNNEDIDPITTITNSFKFTGQLNNLNFPNPFTRYFGSGLFSHFPCSLNCSETKRKANESFESLQLNFPAIAKRLVLLENSFVIFHKEEGVYLWGNFNYANNTIQLDKNSFQGQGELKTVFETIDEMEISQTELILYSNSAKTSVFKTDGCFIETFAYWDNAEKE